MPVTSFTIDSVEVRPVLSTFDVRETVGGVSTLSCDILSKGLPVQRYGVFSEVVVVEDGVTIFAGTITHARERGIPHGEPVLAPGTGAPQIVTTITAADHNRIAERISVTETVAEGTLLKTFLTTLVTNYLDDFGVTLDAAQVNGPALPAMTFETQRANVVLQALADATGYVWRIGYDKALRMWLPGDLAAPFDIDQSDSPPKWGGDVEVETVLGTDYANRVIVVVDDITVTNQVDQLVGNDLVDQLVLTYPIAKHNRFVVVTPGYFYEPLGDGHPTGPTWVIEADNQTITRIVGSPTPNLPTGYTATITYDGLLAISATAEDAAEIALRGVYEHVERRSDITTQAAAQELADAILAERLASGEQTVTYTTRYTAPTLRAGQQQNIVCPARNVSGDFIIRDVRITAETSPMAATGWLTRTVTAKAQGVLVGKFEHTYRDWLKAGGSGGTTTVAGTGTPIVSGGPAPPDESLQYNRAGGFGGSASLTFDEDATTVKLGLNHTSGGADNLLVGDGHVVN